MKTGTSLTDIAAQLERQIETRRDFVAPQGVIEAEVVDGEVVLDGINGDPFRINNHAHGQLADHLGIPTRYYTRLREKHPELLANEITAWLHDAPKEGRMIRTLDGKVRAFLSPKFRPLDNYDLAKAILPTLVERKVRILSAELTETRLYIKGILPELSEELPEGLVWGSGHTDISHVAKGLVLPSDQIIQVKGRGRLVSAITISNSEVGAGTLRIEPSVFTTWCTNLAILVRAAMKKYHVGRAWEADDNFEVFTDETRKQDDAAFFLKVRDITAAAFNEETFRAAIDSIREAGGKQIASDNLEEVVDVTVRQLSLPVSTAPSILSFLARGGDLSQWGLSSAITAVANNAESYETATQLEYAGGQVLALPPAQWEAISNAK